MRRFVYAILIVGSLLFLSSCEFSLYKTLEYNVSGASDSIGVRYTDRSGDIVEATVASPWSTDFDLFSSERPFLAFIRVDNNGSGDVTVNIVYDDGSVASATATAGGASVDLYRIIE